MSGEGEEWEVVRTVGTEEEATVRGRVPPQQRHPGARSSRSTSASCRSTSASMSQVRMRVPADRAAGGAGAPRVAATPSDASDGEPANAGAGRRADEQKRHG